MAPGNIITGSLLATALTVVALATGWAWRRPGTSPLPAAAGVATAGPERAYPPAVAWSPPASPEAWAEPAGQSGNEQGRFDLFTPGSIYFSPRSGLFHGVVPAAEDVAQRTDFGLELVEVRQEPFPLQLVGYVGGENDYWGVFEIEPTGELFLARRGREFPALGLTVTEFSVGRGCAGSPEDVPVAELAATAVVHDRRTGENIALTSRERNRAGALVATFAPVDSPDERTDLRPGETLLHDGATYRLKEIRMDPAGVTVEKDTPGSASPATRTLSPGF
jgi:hypothetical protein